MAFLSIKELKKIGFKTIGDNVLISDKASIYNAKNISLGSHVRIDDFCILSSGLGGIEIGSFVHIAAYSSLIGAEKIVFEDFVGISCRVSIFSSSDDYMGYSMTNPTVPDKYKKIKSVPVILKKHSLVGAHSVLLPGAILSEGCSVGAMSLVSSKLECWSVYGGVPAKKLVKRYRKILSEEEQLKVQFSEVKFI